MRRILPTLALALAAGCQGVPASSLCQDIDCGGHGTCLSLTDGAGHKVPSCACDTGYTPEASGLLCVTPTDDAICHGVRCSGQGICVSVAGKPSCRCKTGYDTSADGRRCEDPCADYACSGHGTCERLAAGPRCACALGYRASTDGKACLPTSPGDLYTFTLTYEGSTSPYGTMTLDLSDLAAGRVSEKMRYTFYLDSWRGLRRSAHQALTLDPTGKGAARLELTDLFTQAYVERRRWSEATFAGGRAAVTLHRQGLQGGHVTSYAGEVPPVPMLGGDEFPGWTYGCTSAAAYLLAYRRYDPRKMGTQQVEAYWPSTGEVGLVTVMPDAEWTASRPALYFPQAGITVTYDVDGVPLTIALPHQSMVWSRASQTPADLNLPDLAAARPLPPARLPTDHTEATVGFSSADGTGLQGTLTRPQGGGGSLPAVLMVSDILGHDRDAPYQWLPRADLYRQLAAHLAHAGYASLRYDPRTRGGSAGSLARVTPARLAEDAGAALAALLAAKGIDGARIYALAHGSAAAPAVGLLAAAPSLKGFVGLAPALHDLKGEFAYSATAHLGASGFSSSYVSRQRATYLDLADALAAGTYDGTAWMELPLPFWEQRLGFDGRARLLGFAGAALLLRGAEDLQVSSAQLSGVTAAAHEAGQPGPATRTLGGLTHLLSQGSKDGLWEKAQLPYTLSAAAVDELLAWLAKH